MIVNIFPDKLLYSPFDFKEYNEKFNGLNILLCKSVKDANIIASSYMSVLDKYVKKFGKKKRYLLWTHEPYNNWEEKSKVKRPNGVIVNVMNCYTRDVFTHNYRYFYFKNFINWNNLVKLSERKNIVVLSTYYDKSYYEKNKHTILPIRYKVIEQGVKRNLVDVYGKNWDKHKFVRSVANSRNDKDRRESKREILSQYKFNICLENTSYEYYVTEKIWEPIKYGVIPIYYGNGTIYQTFNRGTPSFIDVREFINSVGDINEGIAKMYEYLENMDDKQWYDRYKECVRVFNKVIEDGKNNGSRLTSDNLNINYLEYDTCYEKLVEKIKEISAKKKLSFVKK